MAAGYGRGGRAEAIRKALNQPIRLPGSKPEQATLPQQSHQAVGRSALLQQHGSRIGLPDVVGVHDPDPVLPLIGRGRSAVLQAAISGQNGHRNHPSANSFTSSGSSASSGQSSCSSPCPTDQNMPSDFTSTSQSSSGNSSCKSGLCLSPYSSPDQSMPSDSNTTSQSSGGSSKCKPGSSEERVSRLQYMLECIELSQPALIRQGSKGQEIPICANYIPVHCENKGVYLYSVSFSPTIDSKPMRFHILNEHLVTIGSVRAFDGALLFLPIRLPQNKTILKSIRPTDGEEITICITLTKVLDPASCVPLYNIIFRRIMSILKMCQLQRHYYDPTKAVLIPQHKLEVWPGYVTAVNEYEGGLMMLVDVSHHVLRTDTVWDVMVDVVETTTPQNVRKVVTEKILGQVVLTRYNNRTYAVDDIMWDKTPRSTFISSSGREMTYIDYYKMHYNMEICDLDQPLLIHRPRKHARDQKGRRHREQLELICLIPELCYITGMSVDVIKDFRVMKDLSLHTRITPDQRRLALNKFCHNVNSTPDARAELEKWGLSLDIDAICLNGRVLPRDQIIFKNGPTTATTDWSQSVGREHVLVGVDLINWMILYPKRDAKRAHSFIQCVLEVSPAMGWQVARPFIMELPTDNTQCYLRAVRENLTPNTQIVVAIFPTSRDDRYNAFKQLCCVEAPVPSQVINVGTISRKDRLHSIVQRIALQMNCKLGGELWRVNIPTSSIMICGIDTYHSPGKKDNSVGGFVASLNSQCTQWFSVVCHQTHGQDLIDGLKMCFLRSLRKWYEVNHALPERIIIYRDGVGDGELSVVEEFEVKQLQGCFLAISDSYQPKLGMIVVQKRNNTRLFAVEDVKNTVKWSNPLPGTVMDHTITRRNMYDFFLVSQHVREGTVTPTHYIVVYDNTGWGPDFVQQLTYKMTKMYYNWTGTVRIPAPVMYAHRLAFQVGQNLKKDPSIKLCDRLFYL